MYIVPRSASANGCSKSFIGKLRDAQLSGEIFYTLKEVQVIIERWRRHHNTFGPHSTFGCQPPAPEAFLPTRADLACAINGVQSDQLLRSDATGTT